MKLNRGSYYEQGTGLSISHPKETKAERVLATFPSSRASKVADPGIEFISV